MEVKKQTIAVLVSGGVDSSVALKLLVDQRYSVTAFYLKIWLEDELAHLASCPWQEDLAYVEAVCSQLNVPLEVISLQDEYWKHVVSYAIAQVKAGRTPNPDIMCNSLIKFGAFLNAIGSNFDKVATGHYAQVKECDGTFQLYSAPDPVKDQTYFLSGLTQEQLGKAMFPIGHLAKPQVRELAQRYGLPTKDRKDSQGICFLGKLKFSDFLKENIGENPGDFIEYETGKKLGAHQGFWFYTVGQRQGIGLNAGPWYVVRKDPGANTIFISKSYHADDKVRDSFFVQAIDWIGKPPESYEDLCVKLRHGPQMHRCTIMGDSDRIAVKLATRDQGIAPGQFAVFYKKDRCIGSAVIIESAV